MIQIYWHSDAKINSPRFVGDQELHLPYSSQTVQLGDQLTLGVRPEHFKQSDGDSVSFDMEVDVAEHLGGMVYIYRTYQKNQLIIEMEGNRPVTGGDQISVTIPAKTCYLFDNQGRTLQVVR